MVHALMFKLVALFCCGAIFAACGGETAPETNYPVDSETGYQPGGGMMPTFAPSEELATLTPSE